MQFNDQIDFVRQHIKKNKLRVFMTILAATMGTAFLIVLASVGFGIHDTMRNEILDNRLVNEIEVYASDMDKAKVEELKKRDKVKAVVYRQSVTIDQQTELDGFLGSHNMTVTEFQEEAKVGFALQEGRLPENKNEVVVGSHFAEGLIDPQETDSEAEPPTYKESLIGKQIHIQNGIV